MKYRTYTAYKKENASWFNEIPEHWECLSGKYIFNIKKKIAGCLGHDVLSITNKGIQIKDIESGGGQLSMDYSKYQLVKPGDFAMNQMDLLTGYVDISKYGGVISPDYRAFSLSTRVDQPRFFLYLLQLCYKEKLFFPFGQGSSQVGRWRLPRSSFNNFQYPVPPRKERESIVNFLDLKLLKIDGLLGKQERLIELLKEKRQSIISHVVTKGLNSKSKMKPSGLKWLGEIPLSWHVIPFKKLFKSKVDYRGRTPEKIEDGVQLITAKNIKDNSINYSISREYISKESYLEVMKRGRITKGDILFTTEAPLGNVALIDRTDVALAQRIIKFSCKDEYINEYVFYLMQSQYFQSVLYQLSTGSTAMGIKWDRMTYISVPIPPKDEQLKIISYLNVELARISKLIERSSRMMDALNEKKVSLIFNAVTGRIRVID